MANKLLIVYAVPPRGVVPYIGYIGDVRRERVWLFSRFGLK